MSEIIVPTSVLDIGDLADAVRRQCSSSPDLLPPDPADEAVHALQQHDQVARWTASRFKKGSHVGSRPTVRAWKSASATRPVTPLSLPERALLDHLTRLVERIVNDCDLVDADTSLRYGDFKSAPIASGAPFVVGADVNAFYEYVDHETLLTELVERSGDWEVPRVLVDLLGGVMGASLGLPQGTRSIATLGDIYLFPAIRSILRSGFDAWTHSDDMRVAVSTRAEGFLALETLGSALCGIGLTLNAEKCWVRSQDEYVEWSTKPEQMIEGIRSDYNLGLALWLLDDYPADDDTGDSDTEDPQGVRDTVSRIFDWALTTEHPDHGAMAWCHRKVLDEALRKGRTYEEPSGVRALSRILSVYPQLTPSAYAYLHANGGDDEMGAGDVLDEIIRSERHLSAWELAWMAWSCAPFTLRRNVLDFFDDRLSRTTDDITAAWLSTRLCEYGLLDARDLLASLPYAKTAVGRDVLLAEIARRSSDLSANQRSALAESAHEIAIVAYLSPEQP